MPAVVQVRVPTSEERAAAAKIEAERIEKYHEIWRAIHATALTGELTEAKLLSILKELPAGTCSCLGNFTAICKADPLPADAGRQFAWSVRVHNAVNRSLGKPELSEEAAWAIYRPEA